MPVTGVIAGLLAKLGGLGTATKAALAGVTAVTTMGLAGGAAGVLPGPAQNVVAAAVNAATPFSIPDAGGVVATVERAVPELPAVQLPQVSAVGGGGVGAQPPVSVDAGAKAGSTSGSASASANAGLPGLPGVPGLPNLPNATVPSIPQVTVPPALSGVVNGLPACVKNLVPTGGTPDPTKLATQIPGCITQVLGTANLPPEVARCVSSVLGIIGGASGMNVGSIPGIGSLNVSACAPLDASRCVTSMMSFLGTLPGSSGGLPGLGSIPGLDTVTGCVPMDVTRCITSITSAVSAGTAPKLDLSACMPTTALPTLPGISSLPGLAGVLPFFGR